MKNMLHLTGKTGTLLTALLLCFGMRVLAAPSVEGETELTAAKDEVVSAQYTITSDEAMESASLTLTYDRDMLTYMSGSGGNNFAGNGGNGSVQLSSKPGATTATFAVKFRAKADGETTIGIHSCTITVNGKEIDVLSGVGGAEEGESEASEEDLTDEDRASWVIDERTFYLHNPGGLDGFDAIHMDIQGKDSRVLKHDSLELYVIRLFSDNGSYRDHFVYNPDTGNVVPYIQIDSGPDTVVFIEPDSEVPVPVRYAYVDMPWGAKYSVPAYKHVIIDGIDEIFDDTNRYLVYGINQEGEKAWYSYDYDKNTLQLFDETAYQGEQNYIEELEINVEGQKSAAEHILERYNNDMGRRLTIIMVMTILIIILLNVILFMYLKMRRMYMPQEDEEEEEPVRESVQEPGKFIVGNLEENETDFTEPESEDDDEEEEDEEEELGLEIIDLDDSEDDEL